MKHLPILIVFLFVYTNGDSTVSSDHHLHNSLRQFTTLHKDELTHQVLYHDQLTGYHLRMVKFNMMGRDFELHLSPHKKLFTNDFVAYHVNRHGNKTLHEVDKNHFYSGHVFGDKKSSVVAHISEVGVFTGMVATSDEVYHIEPSHRFIKEPHNYHMIAYSLSDVKFNFSNKSIDFEYGPNIDDNGHITKTQPFGEIVQNSVTHGNRRLKRALIGNTCQMYLVADTYFFNGIGNNNVDDSIIFMVTLIAAIDTRTFRDATFSLANGNLIRDLGIQVSFVMVHTEFNDDPDRFPYNVNDGEDIDVILNRFSTLPSSPGEPQDQACLAHLFTYRTFTQSRLGLANIASPSLGATGGICSKPLRVGSSMMIYNTGVSSFRLGRRTLLRVEGQLVVAHEIGHNWGSFHDPPEDRCANQFLMYQFAHSGNNLNNFLFSPCSEEMIGEALSTKGDCFTDIQRIKCGNFILEEGEECDAGLGRNDPCCNDECELRPEAVCSDVNYDCCINCSVASTDRCCHVVTGISPDCTTNTTCNGVNVTCPELELLPAGSECLFGECALQDGNITCTSLCVVNNMTSCQCAGDDACRVCCSQRGSEECVPLGNTLMDLSDGVPCQENGRCVSGTCITEPQDGIQKLFNFIRNLSGDAVIRAIEENIVGSVLICTVLLWVPVSLLIHFLIDRKLYKRFLKYLPEEDKKKIRLLAKKDEEKIPLQKDKKKNTTTTSPEEFFSVI